MKRQNKKTSVVVGLALTSGIVILWIVTASAIFPFTPTDVHASAVRSASPLMKSDSHEATARTAPKTSSDTHEALPPTDANLRSVLADLSARADRGDARAACRLASDLDFCRRSKDIELQSEFHLTRAALMMEDAPEDAPERDSPDKEEIESLLKLDQQAIRAAAICDGLDDETISQSSRRLLQAAQLGDVSSMVRFALRPPFGDSIDPPDPYLVESYRNQALEFLEHAATAGDPTAVLALHKAYESGGILTNSGQFPIDRDPVRATATGMAMLRYADAETKAKIEQTLRDLRIEIGISEYQRALKLEKEYLSSLRRRVGIPENYTSSLSEPTEYGCDSIN